MTISTRKLSNLEHFLRSRTASGFYKSFQLSATYSQELTVPILYGGLRQTLLQYPNLICYIAKDEEAGDCYFKPLESATLNDLVEILPESDYLYKNRVSETFMKYANTTEFSIYLGKPLFKLFLIGKYNLSIVLEHTIADGLVGPFFHEVLLDNIITIIKNDSVDKSVDLNTELFNFEHDRLFMNSLPPPIDWFMAPYTEEYLSNVSQGTPELMDVWPGRTANDYNMPIAFKLINIPPKNLAMILDKCKQEKVTVTSYIEAIQILTLAPIFGEQHHTSNLVAMSLRRFIDHNQINEVDQEIYKCQFKAPNYKYMATAAHVGLSMKFPQITQFNWDFVRCINNQLKEQMKNNRLLNTLSSFFDEYDKLDDNVSFFSKNMKKPGKVDSTKLSNLGLFKFPNYASWTIEDMVFSQDVMPFSADFMLNIISTPTRGMNLVWSYFEDDSGQLNKPDSIDTYVQIFEENIMKYTTPTSL